MEVSTASRHVPIEEAYDSPLRVVEIDEADHATPVVQTATDGSCKTGTGGFAAVLLAPYADIETAIVGRGRMPGESTNIMAEVRAAVLGLRMALQLHKSTGVEFFQLLTDSMFVVQAVEEDLTAGRHAALISTLLQVWTELSRCCSVQIRWVKGHAGHVLNSLTDRHAKATLAFRSTRVDYRYALPGSDLPGHHN